MKILINNDIKTLSELGIQIYKIYPDIRFLFEIDFSKDDYLFIKQLFQKDFQIKNAYFQDDFFIRYFRNNQHYRIPFLILLVGFIRYEYLNNENNANFFDNFLKHIINNNTANSKDFRKSLINYFFRWRGKKVHDEKGLYIYDTQTSGVSLKLEDAGGHKYLNSFIFHSGGISEKDLKEYLKIIMYLSKKNIDYNINTNQLYEVYEKKDFIVYSKKLNNLFLLLNTDNEISKYIKIFVLQSIAIMLNHKQKYNFKIPLYVKNYLLFVGKYGNSLEKINIGETDFIYENQSVQFSPTFNETYKQLNKVSLKINNKVYNLDKEYEIFTSNDFHKFRVQIDNFEKMFTIELLIDDNIFKRYDINLMNNGFILLDSNFNIKKIQNREIYIPRRDEGKEYYIITKKSLDLNFSNQSIDGFNIYILPLDRSLSIVHINNKDYTLYFSPKLLSNIQYENNDFLYFSELPKFKISPKDKEKFIAINLFDSAKLNYDTFYSYHESIGKFEIRINQKIFKVIYINSFEIIEWFNWYDTDKVVKVKLSDERIKTNSDETNIKDGNFIHTYMLKEKNNTIFFNQTSGNNIQLELLKPTVAMSW